jgi:uncharacterized SAM-binding protein YcdF (DUF218 family)
VIVRLWWKGKLSRTERIALSVPYICLLLISTPAFAFLASASLEWTYTPMSQRPEEVDTIVVLSGYVSPPNESRDYAVLGRETLARCLHATALFHQGPPCRIIVSGGKVDPHSPGPSFAASMKEFLMTQGIEEEYILLEDRSGNTHENAVESCKLLREHGYASVVLVTDASSLLRAEKCFNRQGVDVIPSGCRYRTKGGFRPEVVDFLPSLDALRDVSEVWHEWLGLGWYWLRDRI